MNLSVDNFRTKFFQDGNPYWRVFKGRNAGKESFVLAANTSMEDMEQSWSMLEQTFSLYPYGSVTVVTKSSPHAKDGIQSWIEWGQQPVQPGQPAISGFNNSSGSMGIHGIEQMWNFSQSMFQSQVKPMIEAVKKDNEIEMLKNRIRDLEESPGSPKDMIIAGIAENIPGILQTIIGLVQPQRAAQSAIGTLGQQQPPFSPAGEDNDQDGAPIDLNVIYNCALSLSETFPEHDVNELLINLAKYCKTNKGQATMLIKMIMPS